MEGEGEGGPVLLPVPLCIAEGEADLDSLVDAGGGREDVNVGAAVFVLYCAGGGAAVLVGEVAVVAEGGVGGEEDPVPADLGTALSLRPVVRKALAEPLRGRSCVEFGAAIAV